MNPQRVKARDEGPGDQSELSAVGQSEHRVDALGKVLGEADFTADIPFDDLAHGRLVRSSVSHARIESVDVDDALAMEGVIDVVLPSEVPGNDVIGSITPDQPILNDEKVRFIGDPVALVVAESETVARRAADSVSVSYARLPQALTPVEALDPNAEPIHESGNLMEDFAFERGDPARAFEDADIVVEDTYQSAMIDHVTMEPESSVARRSRSDEVEVWTSTQHPHGDRAVIASVLGLGESDVEVHCPAVGGGFGSKAEHVQPCYAAVAAWVTERPVRVKYTRDGDFQGTAKRNTLTLDYRVAADDNGRLRAFDVDITVDGGAYGSYTIPVTVRSLAHCTGPYNVEHVTAEGRAVYTNKPWAGAMRSFDMFQTTFAIESIIDEVAAAADVDPIAIRRLNAYDGELPAPVIGQNIESVGLPETIEAVADRLADRDVTDPADPAKRRGVGVACMWYGCGKTGHHHPSSAFCEIHTDGTATVQCGAAEIGQGSDTALTQIAAETLGIPAEDVRLVSDSSTAPDAGVTSASRQTYVSGNAVRLAAEDAITTLRQTASELFQSRYGESVDPDSITVADGTLTTPATDIELSMAEAVSESINSGKLLTGRSAYTPLFDFDLETFRGEPYPTYAFATHGVIVEVDGELGTVSVERIVASHDVGQAINPALVEGQIEGGAVMGMGHTLMEEVELDNQGQILNASLMDYHIPTSMHVPEIETHIVESSPEDDGPYGAKGVGESALIPVGPAIANAVQDATGRRITDLPLKPSRVRDT